MPDAAVACMVSSTNADDVTEAAHIVGSMTTAAISAMDAIGGAKRLPIIAIDTTDVMDATDAAIATINQMADAAQAAETADFAAE